MSNQVPVTEPRVLDHYVIDRNFICVATRVWGGWTCHGMVVAGRDHAAEMFQVPLNGTRIKPALARAMFPDLDEEIGEFVEEL